MVGIRGDVSKMADLDRVFAQIKQEAGRLDIVFANAGIAKYAALGTITEELYQSTFDINVKGVLFTVQPAKNGFVESYSCGVGNPGNDPLAAPQNGVMGDIKVVLGEPRANRATNVIELVETSNKSECTRESEVPSACLAVCEHGVAAQSYTVRATNTPFTEFLTEFLA